MFVAGGAINSADILVFFHAMVISVGYQNVSITGCGDASRSIHHAAQTLDATDKLAFETEHLYTSIASVYDQYVAMAIADYAERHVELSFSAAALAKSPHKSSRSIKDLYPVVVAVSDDNAIILAVANKRRVVKLSRIGSGFSKSFQKSTLLIEDEYGVQIEISDDRLADGIDGD